MLDGTATPGGGPLLVSLGCQMTRPPQVGDRFWCPQGARRPNHPRWRTTFGVLRVPDWPTTPGGGPLLVLRAPDEATTTEIVKCIEPFAKVHRKCRFHYGFLKVGVTNHCFLRAKMLPGNFPATVAPSTAPFNTTPLEPLQSKTVWGNSSRVAFRHVKNHNFK